MGYCVVADVQSDFKSIVFNSSTNVTDTAVTGFITEASALMDSYIGQRWVTPVTAGADALSLLSLYCRTIVRDRVRGILATQQKTNSDGNATVRGAEFTTSDVMKALQSIAEGGLQLNGATLLNLNASMFSNNQNRGVRPRFHKNRKQW